MTADRRIRHIVLYGSLCRAEPAHARLGLEAALAFVGARAIAGRLFDLGPYPGLVRDGVGPGDDARHALHDRAADRRGDDRFVAELYRIVDASALARLDGFEGYDARRPERSLFVRRPIELERFGGSTRARLTAWVYVYAGPVDGRPRIVGESWRDYRRRRDGLARPFAGFRSRG